MTKDNNGKWSKPSSCQTKTSGWSYATVVCKTMANLPNGGKGTTPEKGNDNAERKMHVAKSRSQSFVQKSEIISAKKSRERFDNHAKLVKMVASVMVVYVINDQGHNQEI